MEHLVSSVAAKGGVEDSGRTSLREAAQQFETYFVRMMLEEMRRTVGAGGLFENRSTRGYETMLYDALAERATESSTFGLAEQIVEQIERRLPSDEAASR